MPKLNIDRSKLDHPEHFDDEIREFRHSDRYVPTTLEQILFELAGHRCTICGAPWLELHHITELSKGGVTCYENLIVLCPNCHARVHQDGTPSKAELRHYKLKQEIAYELPILSRLSRDERSLIARVSALLPIDQVAFSERHQREIEADSQHQAILECRRRLGLMHLQESGMVSVEQDICVTQPDRKNVLVSLNIRFTGKGIKWLRYLKAAERVPSVDG